MQERRYDGTEKLTPNVSEAEVLRAMRDPSNQEVSIHRAGSIISTLVGGHRRKFRVEADGSLTRVHLTTLQPIQGS